MAAKLTPARVGLLIDYLDADNGYDENILPSLQLVADDYRECGILERPVEFVVRAVQGLPNGSFRAVRDAFYELVEEDALIIFGPWVSENGVALRRDVEELRQVPIITMAASESMLGQWVFGLPAGSLEEEPIIMATVAGLDGCRTVGIAFEDSLIGHQYLRSTRVACQQTGLLITAEVPIPQVESQKSDAMTTLAADKPDALMHLGFGLGIIGMNAELEAIGWNPRRYTTTAFEFAATDVWWRRQLAGWIGLDQFDERNMVGQRFLDRFQAQHGRRPEYFFPLYCYDVARLMMTALATARPLTGPAVKDALEKIKMLPAATGAPGTRMRFGNFIRHGWVGSEFLVARRVLPDASRSVLHATINGFIESPLKGVMSRQLASRKQEENLMPEHIAFDVRVEPPSLEHYRREWVPGPGVGLAGMWLGAVVADASGQDYWGLRGADDFLPGMTHVVSPITGFRKLQKTFDADPPHLFDEYSTIDWFEPLDYVDSGAEVQLRYDSGRIERDAEGLHWYDASGRWEMHGTKASDIFTVHVPTQDGIESEVYYRHELLWATGKVEGVDVSGYLHQDYAYGPPGTVYPELPIARQLQGMWVSWLHVYADGQLGGGCLWQGRDGLSFGPGYQLKNGITTAHDDVVATPTFDAEGKLTALDVAIGDDAYAFAFDTAGSFIHFFGRLSDGSTGKQPTRSWCWVEYAAGMMTPEILDIVMQRVRLARGR